MFSRLSSILLLVPLSLAFPDLDVGALLNTVTNALHKNGAPQANPPFDAKSQLVDVYGDHAFMPPGANDQRGPCPGLNALANHGYLPRSGFADILTFTSATNQVYGMGEDLGAILSVYGAVFDGLLAGWSIGGEQHTGISGSHNNYETDSSPLRGDLNQYGSNTGLIMSQFQELYNMQPDAATANYDIDVLKQFRQKRFNESIANNPYFTYAPFSGAVVSQAAFVFIYRFMANHTAEHSAGVLNKDTLKSFMSIEGPEDNLRWVPGNERIPENWYKRNNNDQYGLVGVNTDMQTVFQGQEYIGQAGCNTGTVNTYAPIDAGDLTDGSFSAQDALANPFCYGVAVANTAAGTIPIVNFVVQELLLPVQNLLGCKTVPSLNESVYDACPGYSLYGGPTSSVAPGAVQN